MDLNLEQLATLRASAAAVASATQALADARAAARQLSKEHHPALEEALLAKIKEATGGKASAYLYFLASTPGSEKLYCAYVKGNVKPKGGAIAATWGYWESNENIGIEQIRQFLTEDEYNAQWQVEDDAYQAEQKAEEDRIAAEKQAKLDAKQAAKGKKSSGATEGTDGQASVTDAPPLGDAAAGGEGAGAEAAGEGAAAPAADAAAAVETAPAKGGSKRKPGAVPPPPAPKA